MKIQLKPELEHIIQNQIATGRYHSATEVIQDALALLELTRESQEVRLRKLDEKIHQGLVSLRQGKGIDGEKFFQRLANKGR